MIPFLKETAQDIVNKYKEDIQSYCFVFPNKRTKFFFRKYYAEIYGETHKAPDMIEIKLLTQAITKLRDVDNLKLIFILYQIFKESDNKNEYNFDKFYRLGEIILSDFNEIDNWLIESNQIFQNIKNIKEIDAQFDWLTEEQKEVLKSFWINFSAEEYSKEQEMFIELWNLLPEVYKKFTNQLLKEKIAYSGLKNRELAKKIKTNNLEEGKYIKYIFIGFNALNKGELNLFKYLHKKNKAEFYWDTDKYYQNDKKQEAGDFLRKNFKELFLSDKDLPENFLKNKNINLIGVPLNVGQAKVLPSILKNYDFINNEESTAIVLADEHLLFPALSSLPENISEINVTMGYPFKLTTLFGLIMQYANLHTGAKQNQTSSFYHKNVIDILRHTLIKEHEPEINEKIISEIEDRNIIYVQSKYLISNDNEILKLLFTKIPQNNALDIFLSNILNILFLIFNNERDKEGNLIKDIENEYIHKAYVKTKQLREIFRENNIEVGLKLGTELLMQILRQEQIAFEGEAVDGLQLMGVMESRNLDFKNLIILGMNEGNMPAVSKAPTFISQSMRFAFGMPMIKYQDAVYAYFFYSLIQRAENISLIYNNIVNTSNAGEISRFILQLKNETEIPIKEYQFNQNLFVKKQNEIIIKKTPEVIQILNDYFVKSGYAKRKFSPGGINTYLDCSLQFYFKYIAKFKETNIVEEEFSHSVFGSILHNTLENIYKNIIKEKSKNIIEKTDINKIYKKVEKYVDEAFKTVYDKNQNYKITGSQIIIKKVIINYVNLVLKKDENYTPFEIISVEDKDKFISEIKIKVNDKIKTINLSGIIDRIDKKDGIYRVIDYKTGKEINSFQSVKSLFDIHNKNRGKHVLQTFIYTMNFIDSQAPVKVNAKPIIYYVRTMKDKNSSEIIFLKQNKKSIELDEALTKRLLPEFTKELQQTLENIFNPELPFIQTKNKNNCEFCSYKELCF